uniref:Uncharacterized protein n=1 Tax=Neisseria meningitidis alpha522 TaxID=996307 RepID=I4E6T1_NEIME|nr:hypothetical protein NMALPHA522_1508 [Neisseria meningitidis alpha522]
MPVPPFSDDLSLRKPPQRLSENRFPSPFYKQTESPT